MNQKKFHQNTIAIVYDFDGTLTPLPMQEYTVLPELGVKPDEFWEQCSKEARKLKADPMLTYMRLILEKVEENKKSLGKAKLEKLASGIRYFPGVDEWFKNINKYIAQKTKNSIEVKHYIISAGLKDILNGISIKKYISRIYACEYFYDHHGIARFPTWVVNDTSKTQFLFRINKGVEDINQSVNEHMPEEQRATPFSNIIYIGDGLTDVPCMSVAKKNGGYAIAVHPPKGEKSLSVCKELAKSNRIDFYCPADYRKDKALDKRVKLILDSIISNIYLQKEKHAFFKKVHS